MKTQKALKKVFGDMDESRQKDGSRNADGNVPSVNLNDDGNVNVNYWNPQNANDNLRFRLEISRNKGL